MTKVGRQKKDSRWGWNQKGGVIISGFPTEPYWDLPWILARISVGMLPKFPSGSFVAGMLPRLPPVSHQFPPYHLAEGFFPYGRLLAF